MADVVAIAGVNKAFPTDNGQLPVLRDLTLEIAEGEVVAVLGPSGCGKSTLLRLVAGLERPSSGEIRLGGRPVVGADPRCAVVFQEPRLFPWKSVEANVAIGGRRLGARPDIDALLQRVGLQGFGGAYPHELSGGMAQRAALARALVGQPDVLLLDEPFAALDALTRIKMQDLLAEICADLHPTVLLITHDVDEALVLADRIALLGHRPSEIVSTVRVPQARPRDRGDASLAPLRARILAHFGLARSGSQPPSEAGLEAVA